MIGNPFSSSRFSSLQPIKKTIVMGDFTMRNILYLITMTMCLLGGQAAPTPRGENHEPCYTKVVYTMAGTAEYHCFPNNTYKVVPPGLHCFFDQKAKICTLKCKTRCNDIIKKFYRKQIALTERQKQKERQNADIYK